MQDMYLICPESKSLKKSVEEHGISLGYYGYYDEIEGDGYVLHMCGDYSCWWFKNLEGYSQAKEISLEEFFKMRPDLIILSDGGKLVFDTENRLVKMPNETLTEFPFEFLDALKIIWETSNKIGHEVTLDANGVTVGCQYFNPEHITKILEKFEEVKNAD